MEVVLNKISKRYLYEWIIKDLTHTFASHSITGINGINGSGKSTLIKMLSGFLSPSEGTLSFHIDGKTISRDEIYQYISIAAPYTDLVQEYDVKEQFYFHKKFKPFTQDIDFDTFLDLVNLKGNIGKQIQYYSSGMKQRLQLALAVLTKSQLLLLDEPTSYLDDINRQWFYDLLKQNSTDRTIIIASNDENDFQLCKDIIHLE